MVSSKRWGTPPPPAFKESVRVAEQNLYTQAKRLVGDREPRQLEFTIQLRAFDTSRSGPPQEVRTFSIIKG